MSKNNIKLDLDINDKLSSFRDKFYHSKNEIYLDGNSLGKKPNQVNSVVENLLNNQWGKKQIAGWNEHWLELNSRVSEKIARLLNANSNEILVGESTSVSLYKITHAIVSSSIYPKQLITDSLNFPTDNYIIDGICKQLKLKKPICVSYTNDLEADLEKLKTTILENPGIICLSLVTYKSSFLYNMKELNYFSKNNNSIIIWDLSHAVGVVNIDLKLSNTLVAVGCTYKYLNGGPGSPSFLYVNNSLIESLESPILGWFGHKDPFSFSQNYNSAIGINKFKAGTPQVLSLAALEVGVDITLEAGIQNIRTKSELMSQFFIQLIQRDLASRGFKLESPMTVQSRGSHITVSHKESWRICKSLINPYKTNLKIIPDYRPEYYLRFGISPLYNTFSDLILTIERLKEIFDNSEYLRHNTSRLSVT